MQGRYEVLFFSFMKISNATVTSKQNFIEKYHCLKKIFIVKTVHEKMKVI